MGPVVLLQSGTIFFKVGQVLQSGTVFITNWTGIKKWGSYYKVFLNTFHSKVIE